MNVLCSIDTSSFFSGFDPLLSGSALFDGAGYLSNSGNLSFGTGNWTIEMWVRLDNLGARQGLFATGSAVSTTGSIQLYIEPTSGTISFETIGITSGFIFSTTAVPINTWTHIALTRNSTTYRIWVNGINTDTKTMGTTSSSLNAASFAVGARTGGGLDKIRSNGRITGFRTSNVVRYTSTFTPSKDKIITGANYIACYNMSSSDFVSGTLRAYPNTTYNATITGGTVVYSSLKP